LNTKAVDGCSPLFDSLDSSQNALFESVWNGLTADARERDAEDSQNSSISSDSEVHFCVSGVVSVSGWFCVVVGC